MTLNRRQLYMLPTRYGFLFALVLLVLLIAAMNYSNGLTYALTFLLAGVAIVSMLYTHRNLVRLEITPGLASPVFAGETARFALHLHNAASYPRFGVCIGHGRAVTAQVDMEPQTNAIIHIPVITTRRGRIEAAPFKVSTRYPLGLFYSWSRKLALGQQCLVYPRPGPERPLPLGPDHSGQRPGARQGDDDFAGLRAYVPVDAPGHVHWKAAARGQDLLTKQFAGAQAGPVWLDWDAVPERDSEARLSQLCRWALDAERAGLHFGLRLPTTEFPFGQGPAHLARCLEALALY